MKFEKGYPDLITIADIASDLETLKVDDPYIADLWSRLTRSFDELKNSLKPKDSA